MEQTTLAEIMKHHYQCGGFEFTKSDVQSNEKGEKFIRYRCLKCKHEIHERLDVVNKKAA